MLWSREKQKGAKTRELLFLALAPSWLLIVSGVSIVYLRSQVNGNFSRGNGMKL
jgi:hypothetical protein